MANYDGLDEAEHKAMLERNARLVAAGERVQPNKPTGMGQALAGDRRSRDSWGEQPPAALQHGRNCPYWGEQSETDCTCGLRWRIALQTEQTMHAAWRKRAEEAEEALIATKRDNQPGVIMRPITTMAGAEWNILDASGCRIAWCGYDNDHEKSGPSIAKELVRLVEGANPVEPGHSTLVRSMMGWMRKFKEMEKERDKLQEDIRNLNKEWADTSVRWADHVQSLQGKVDLLQQAIDCSFTDILTEREAVAKWRDRAQNAAAELGEVVEAASQARILLVGMTGHWPGTMSIDAKHVLDLLDKALPQMGE